MPFSLFWPCVCYYLSVFLSLFLPLLFPIYRPIYLTLFLLFSIYHPISISIVLSFSLYLSSLSPSFFLCIDIFTNLHQQATWISVSFTCITSTSDISIFLPPLFLSPLCPPPRSPWTISKPWGNAAIKRSGAIHLLFRTLQAPAVLWKRERKSKREEKKTREKDSSPNSSLHRNNSQPC